ncbi:hypothetical protein P0082_07710 [Candidatus Haliotispira prima]|uniref:Tail fiber protein n=1 Tax=Candidatus Haliotispira prima TaxID=3034016 RepID=A0ABY8MES5_9SPIO|nr:hypothetical protein P0082_07710 [Candidatus Haliotispira prima]
MARNNDTLWLPENVSITDVASGTEVSWPGTNAAGDFQGRPDDSTKAPSYLDSGWLSRVNRTFGRLFNARGSGALSHNTTVAEVASSVSPYWMEGGTYVSGSQVLHGGTWYIATGDHTATAQNAPGQSGAPWESVDYRNFNKLYPIGSLYINYSSPTNPGEAGLLGFGTWAGLPADHFPAQAGGVYVGGKTEEDGLPNITGRFGYEAWPLDRLGLDTNHHIYHKGVFHPIWNTGAGNDRATSGGSRGGACAYSFSASRSSPIYGRTSYVRPKTIGVYMWRRMA